jgi:NADH-quinone oxidoreductase subunit G
VINGSRAYVLASPMLSNESLYLLSRVVERTSGVGVYGVRTGPEAPLAGVPDLALRSDRAANVRGAELMGFERRGVEELFAGLRAGDVLVVADEELDGVNVRLAEGVRVVVVGTTVPAWAAGAEVVLPTPTWRRRRGRSPTCAGACSASRRPRRRRASRAQLVRARRPAGGDGATGRGTSSRPTPSRRSPPRTRASPGMSYDTLGLRGQPVADAERFAAAGRARGGA